jgi:ABC-type multidrug transport system fused ATPase/permease subunit
MKMHDSMLERVINAPVNLFFDTHRKDKIQERFTSDLGTLEHNFIGDITHTLYYHISMFIMISQVEWKVVLVYPFICYGMYFIFSRAFAAHMKLEKL